MTVLYRPAPGQGEPAQLVFSGSRAVTVPIPFRFENVPVQ